MDPETYSHFAFSVFVGSVVTVLSVETLLEARLRSEDAAARRALRRWACVGVALCCFVALFLEFEKGEGLLWMVAPLLFGPLLGAWFYVLRLLARAVSFRLLPVAAFSLGSGALLVTSLHFDVPPFVLVLPTYLGAAVIGAAVVTYRSFTAPRKLGGWPPADQDDP